LKEAKPIWLFNRIPGRWRKAFVLAFCAAPAYWLFFSVVYVVCLARFEWQIRDATRHEGGRGLGSNGSRDVCRIAPLPAWKRVVAALRARSIGEDGNELFYEDGAGTRRIVVVGAVVPPKLRGASAENGPDWLRALGFTQGRGYWSTLFWHYPALEEDCVPAESTRDVALEGGKLIFYFERIEPNKFFSQSSQRGLVGREVLFDQGERTWTVAYRFPACGQIRLFGPDATISPALSEYCLALCEWDASLLQGLLEGSYGVADYTALLNIPCRIEITNVLDRVAGYCSAYPQQAF